MELKKQFKAKPIPKKVKEPLYDKIVYVRIACPDSDF